MTSIIKVDQIQTAAGGVPTAADLGLDLSGTVIQYKHTTGLGSAAVVSTSTWSNILGSPYGINFVPKSTSNKLVVKFFVSTYGSGPSSWAGLCLHRIVNGNNSDATLFEWPQWGSVSYPTAQTHARHNLSCVLSMSPSDASGLLIKPQIYFHPDTSTRAEIYSDGMLEILEIAG